MKPLPIAAVAGAIAAWFLYFAHGGLQAGLSADDLMNLYGYLQKPTSTLLIDALRFWSTAYRPLGAFFYVPLYHAFWLNPLPYRIVCFLILGANLVLMYQVSVALTKSREIAFLATFIGSYHAWFIDLYYSAGTIYDLLCYALYMGAFLVYIRIRAQGSVPGLWRVTSIVLLYVLALDAKEMAATFPLMLLLYEATFRGVRPRLRDCQTIWITGLITLVYIVGKLHGPGTLTENPAYALTISPGRFLDTFHLYLNPLLYQDHRFHDSNTVQLLLLMLIIALWRRSPVLVFSWFWLVLTILPVSFIAHYAGFFEYLPAVGWTLYAAGFLVMLRVALMRYLPSRLMRASQAALFLGVAAILAPLQVRDTPKTLRGFMSVQPPTREVTEDLAKLMPRLPHGAHVLFLDDPFDKNWYFLLFETRLFYHDMTIDVQRAPARAIAPSEYPHYDAVFGFRGTRLVLVKS